MERDYKEMTDEEYEELLQQFAESFTAFKAAANQLCCSWNSMNTLSMEIHDMESLAILCRIGNIKKHMDAIMKNIEEIEKID